MNSEFKIFSDFFPLNFIWIKVSVLTIIHLVSIIKDKNSGIDDMLDNYFLSIF